MTPQFASFVEERFSVAMQTQYPGMSFYFSNSKVPTDLDEYAVLHIMSSEDVMPINLGITAKSRNVGLIQVDVFSPKDIGAGRAQNIAYYTGSIFKRQVLQVGTEGLITFKDPSVVDRGEVRGRHKQQMRVPYRYDFQDFSP